MAAAAAVAMSGCSTESEKGFFRVEEGHFVDTAGSPCYFIGANMWYGAFLATEGPSCDRERLCRELDRLKELGIDNLRIAVGADGSEDDEVKVKPILQTAPGVYNDDALDGLDFLMAELGKRDMYAVLYLTNSWTWSGGYAQYLEWSGHGECTVQGNVSWKEYTDYVGKFHKSELDDPCKRMLEDHIRFIVTRTNRYTGRPYSEDRAIFSWQLCNEPRAFSAAAKENFYRWVAGTARLIKELDANHMVSTGSEGEIGCEVDMELCERIHAIPEIDYINLHIWPYNWRWVDRDTFESDVATACRMSLEYIDRHMELGRKLGKPVVIEEFGYPRDGFLFDVGSPVSARDVYYRHIAGAVVESSERGDVLGGCNFWGWGGSARPQHLFWENGDDYCCDPAQEEQGLYSVFDCDTTTVEILEDAIDRLKRW